MTRTKHPVASLVPQLSSILVLTVLCAGTTACTGDLPFDPNANGLLNAVSFNDSKMGFNDEVESVAVATDGSEDIYVGGEFTTCNGAATSRIARLNSDGSLDQEFNVGSGFNNRVLSVAPARDGSGDVYVGGFFTTYNGSTATRIARLNADGSLDSAFAMASATSEVADIAPATDGTGDIFIVGNFTNASGSGSVAIARLSDTGSVVNTAPSGGFNNEAFAIDIAANGSGDVYVGGPFTTYAGISSSRLVRINSSLTIDTGFAVGNGFNNTVRAVAAATDGSGDVYAGGDFTTYQFIVDVFEDEFIRIIRLNSNGTIDEDFTDGVGEGFDGSVRTIATATDGSGDIYVGGAFENYGGSPSPRIVRLNNDGSVDGDFNVGTGGNSTVNSIATATDDSGDLYFGGAFGIYDGMGANRVALLKDDGSVNTRFKIGAGFDDDVLTSVLAADGSGDVYVGGRFNTYNGMASSGIIRFNSDDSVDTSFMVGAGFDDDVHTIVPATDGSGDIYVGGEFTNYNGSDSVRLIRLHEDGSFDDSFVVEGNGFNDTVLTIAPTTDGSDDVYVGGEFFDYDVTSANRIIRLASNGTIDTDFDIGSGFSNFVHSIVLTTDGSGDIYVGGRFPSYNLVTSPFIIRLDASGAVVTSFDIGSGFSSGIGVFTMALATDGSDDLFVGGDYNFFDGASQESILRLNADGSVDTGLGALGFGLAGSVRSIVPAIDGSGDIYVGGSFTGIGQSTTFVPSNNLIRLNSNLSADSGFAIGSIGFNERVRTISLARDGSAEVYVGGEFTIFNDVQVDFAAVLNPNGTLD